VDVVLLWHKRHGTAQHSSYNRAKTAYSHGRTGSLLLYAHTVVIRTRKTRETTQVHLSMKEGKERKRKKKKKEKPAHGSSMQFSKFCAESFDTPENKLDITERKK
jgi:hypothetical protein